MPKAWRYRVAASMRNLPVACAGVAENALLHDGTAQCEALREGAARTGGPIALQKMPDPVVVSLRGADSFQDRPIPVEKALCGHCWDERMKLRLQSMLFPFASPRRRPSCSSRRQSCAPGSAWRRPTIAIGMALSWMNSTCRSNTSSGSLSNPTMNPAITSIPCC